MILPQRQTALVAKQAAEVDILTGGRFRLGDRAGLEPGRVRGAREGLRRPRPPHGGADRAAAAALAGAGARFRRARPHDHRRRPQPAAGAAADPDLDRRLVRGGAPPDRAPRRRLVPDERPGARGRLGRDARADARVAPRGGPRSPTTSASSRASAPRAERRTTGTPRPRSGARSARRTSPSTRCAAASTGPTRTSSASQPCWTPSNPEAGRSAALVGGSRFPAAMPTGLGQCRR